MKLAKLLAAAVTVVGLSAQAQTAHLPGEAPFALDAAGALLVGLHPADSVGFLDLFAFTVAGPSTAAGVFLLPGALSPFLDPAVLPALAGIQAFSIIDSNGATLAIDADGSDGFAVSTKLTSAGTYAFGVLGLGGASLGLYVAAAAAVPDQRSLVPEPETYALMLAGLGMVGWVAKRRSQA